MESDDTIIVVVVNDETAKDSVSLSDNINSSESKEYNEVLEKILPLSEHIKIEKYEENSEEDNCFEYYDYSYLEEFEDEMIRNVQKTSDIDIKNEPVEYLSDEDNVIKHENSNNFVTEVVVESLLQNKKFPLKRYVNKSKDFQEQDSNYEYKDITVKELKRSNPRFKTDQPLLIKTLVEIMTAKKSPEPPTDIYTVSEEGLSCNFCKTVTDRHNAATRHYQDYHGPRYLSCYGCSATFRSCNNLYRHEMRCPSADAIVILKARAVFLGKKGRGRPFLSKTPFLKKINMGVKSTLFNIESTKEITASGEVCFLCPQCPAVFKTKYGLIAHKNMHEGIRPYQCDTCTASYTAKSALNRHLLTHIGPQFTCDYCGRSLMTKPALRQHIDTHFNIKKYHCTECDKRYTQKNALRMHVNKIHKKLPPTLACEVCPKKYYKTYLLKEHMMKEHGLVLMTKTMLMRSLPTMPNEEVDIDSKIS